MISGNFRAEVESLRSSSQTASDAPRVDGTSVMINGLYDVPTGIKLKPYVSAGFGTVDIQGRSSGDSAQ